MGNDDPDAIELENYAKNNGGNAYNGEFALLELYKAALEGKLGFNAVTGRKYLEGHAEKNDESAQHYLNCAARECKLGFNAETGRTYLEKRAARGDKTAQEQLNQAALDGELGFNAETGLKYFEERAARGDKTAQSQINRAACCAKLIFTDKTGLKYLQERAKRGDENAKIWLHLRGTVLKVNPSLFGGEPSALHRSSEPLYPKKENKSGEALLPSMPSSASVSALPIEPNPQDAINKALERAVNQGNEGEVRTLLNRPAGQLGPDERAINDALEIAHKKNNQSIIIILQNALITILQTAINNALEIARMQNNQSVIRILQNPQLNYKAVAQKVLTSPADIPSVVGSSMPSSVAPSATPPAAIPSVVGPSMPSLADVGNKNGEALELEKLVKDKNNSLAKKRLNDAANNGTLGFTVDTGRTYLLARAAVGDTNAQELLNTKPLPHR